MNHSRIFLFCFSILVSCTPHHRHDEQQEQIDGSFQQLRQVSGALEQTIFDIRQQEKQVWPFAEKIVLETAKRERRGFEIFRCQTNTNFWLRINPDLEKWKNSGNPEFEREIAIYNPIHFYPTNASKSVIVAITFGGNQVNLSKYPKWDAVPVGKIEKESGKNLRTSPN